MRYFFNLPTPQEDRKGQILVYLNIECSDFDLCLFHCSKLKKYLILKLVLVVLLLSLASKS